MYTKDYRLNHLLILFDWYFQNFFLIISLFFYISNFKNAFFIFSIFYFLFQEKTDNNVCYKRISDMLSD